MRKLKLLLAACALFGVTATTWAITIKTDLTAQFSSLTNKDSWTTGAGGKADYTATQYCPAVIPNGLNSVQVCEFYEATCTREGDILYATVTGLTAGTYTIELYGGAAFTYGRGFGSQAFTGETETGGAWGTHNSETYTDGQHIDTDTGVKLYALSEEVEYGGEIPIYYATNFPDGASTVTIENVVVGESGTIKIGMSKTSHSTNWHVVQLKSVIATVDGDAALSALKEQADDLKTKSMNATVLSELTDAANATPTNEEEYKTAIETLTSKIDAAKASVAVYEVAKEILDAANGYDAAGQASYAADATISAIQSAYDDGSLTEVTNDQKTAAKAALVTACKAQIQPADGCDMTAYIVNPDFNSGKTTGWTIDTPYGGNCTIQGGSRMEYWAGNSSNRALASFNISQELTNLPAGVYTVSADMYNSLNGETAADYGEETHPDFSPTCGVYGVSNNEEVVALVTEEGDVLKTYTTGQILVFKGKMTIGTKNTVTPMIARWFLFDNVKLTYARQLTPEEIAANVEPESVSLDPSSVEMAIFETATLVPTVLPENANDKTVSWSSADPTVAIVDGDGVVTAVGVGSTTITATANGADDVTATAEITVTDVSMTVADAPAFYSEIADGDFYIVNAATGKYLGGANSWGTQASQIEHGIPFTVAMNDGKYTLDSHTFEASDKHFFSGTYIDALSTNLYIVSTGDGKYSISTGENSGFVTAKPETTVVDNSAGNAVSVLSQWYFVSKSDRDKVLSDATKSNPVDATYYIKEANFSRNWGTTGKNVSAWTGEHTKGGANENMNAMVQNAVANVYQTIEEIPNGRYIAKVQAVASGDAVFYANDVEADIESKDDVTNQTIASQAFGGGFFWTTLSVAVTDNTLTIGVKSDDTDKVLYFDNFELLYTGPVVDEEVTVTEAGYATYVSKFDLDFSETAITAYTAKVDGGNVVLTSIEKVPANIPVVLYCEGGATEDVPLATSTDTPAASDLVAGEGTIVATTDGDYTNYILNNVDNEIGFYKANDQKVAANRAYLHVPTSEISSARLTIVFEDATGVSDVRGKMSDVRGEIYNLNGQRVTTPKRGLYIVGGKKVVKN